MILFINACVRRQSGTKLPADRLLSGKDAPYTEVRLEEIAFPAVNEDFLRRRDRLLAQRAFDDPMFALARQFAAADTQAVLSAACEAYAI